jgi:hypothetical protein
MRYEKGKERDVFFFNVVIERIVSFFLISRYIIIS